MNAKDFSDSRFSRMCDPVRPVVEIDGRWYIALGRPGFNSAANNSTGYATEAAALSAIGGEVLEFNAADWSGKSVKVRVNRKTGGFVFRGHSFALKFVDAEHFAVVSPDWSSALVVGMKLDGQWLAFHGNTYDDAALTRDHADPYICAIQVLCNVL